MKILELRFKNLNSLYGEWFLDFTSPDFTSNGIFAITGPTGAGKSTILDAICLALYGKTPRLDKINKSGNELMSRQTGECYAEVTFESVTGRFRCHWSQHRARKKADGRLAESRHEVADALSNQILESKKRDVAKVIEEHTGMDFDRFTRSILLAQGGFAAFLQATPDKRAPVLEQITGTEIYSEISKRVHERHRQERKNLELLQAETAGIVLLSDEQEAELSTELIEKQKTEKDLSARHLETEKSIQWLTGIDKLRTELETITKEDAVVSEIMVAFKLDREKLHWSQKAAEVEAEFATLSAKRQQQKRDLENFQKDEEQLPQAVLLLKQQESNLKDAESATTKVKREQKTKLGLIKKVRALDYRIMEKSKTAKSAHTECRKSETQCSQHRKNRQKVIGAQKDALKELEQVQQYLIAHTRDESLVTRLAGITVQMNNFKSGFGEISAKKILIAEQQKLVEKEAKHYAAQQKSFHSRKKEHDAAQQKTVEAKQTLKTHLAGRMLREYRADRDGLLREMVYLQKISALEKDRKKLEDGTPCPLCGSREHPFAAGNVPEVDEIEKQINDLSVLIKSAEKLESSIKEFESKEKKIASQLADVEKRLTQVVHKKEVAEKDVRRLEEELTEVTQRFIQLQQTTLSGLQPFGVTELPENDTDSILQNLSDRLKQWQNYQVRKGDIEKKHSELASETKQLDGIIKTLADSLKGKQEFLAHLNKELEQLTLDRREMYGSKKPDDEELFLEKQVIKTEKADKDSRKNRDHSKQQVAEIQTRITTLKDNIAAGKSELEALEKTFAASRTKAGFVNEQSFLANLLSAKKRHRLLQQAKEIDEKQADILIRKKDRQGRLTRKLEKKITESSLQDLHKVDDELTGSLKIIGQETGAVKQKLSDNKTARKKIKQKQVLIDARKKECARWDRLHALIGSADGKKFRNFAQGITFELMVSHANLQLAKMTERYLLVRDEDQPLELNVIDNYQAGEIRSTKNLSGGESFIVSLSLALGLSKMASRKVRVDSLFLDEGFGTLDEEALETALETLAGLQQDGKLIGIISHVSALKERISTQINIVPVSGGKSMVSGPGCESL